MAETRRKFDADFREGAVRLVRETGKPIAQVARDLGINAGTLGNWVNADARRRGDGGGALGEDERAELARLRKKNAELGWSAMCSNARSPSGSSTRWGGSGGRADRRPEGGPPHSARAVLPGAGSVPVLVLQMARWQARIAGATRAGRLVRPSPRASARERQDRHPAGLSSPPRRRHRLYRRSAASGTLLLAGKVDLRLPLFIVTMARRRPVWIVDFTDQSPAVGQPACCPSWTWRQPARPGIRYPRRIPAGSMRSSARGAPSSAHMEHADDTA
jgi:transposase